MATSSGRPRPFVSSIRTNCAATDATQGSGYISALEQGPSVGTGSSCIGAIPESANTVRTACSRSASTRTSVRKLRPSQNTAITATRSPSIHYPQRSELGPWNQQAEEVKLDVCHSFWRRLRGMLGSGARHLQHVNQVLATFRQLNTSLLIIDERIHALDAALTV